MLKIEALSRKPSGSPCLPSKGQCDSESLSHLLAPLLYPKLPQSMQEYPTLAL